MKFLSIHIFKIITLLVYYPTLKNGFLTGWDDQWMVFSHYTERGWTVDNLWHIFTDFYGGAVCSACLFELFGVICRFRL